MKVITLVENTSINKELKNQHGLSIYIETLNHKILFDLGEDELFLENSKKLNVNIEDVDILVLSHGHKDHGGGLKTFLKHNQKAKIYIHKDAFKPHYVSILKIFKVGVSLEEELKANPRIILTEGIFEIDENLTLFGNVNGNNPTPLANKSLLKREEGKYELDDFSHEQSLIVKEDEKQILFAGCSHCGILNILECGEKITGKEFDLVIGGYHLFKTNMKGQAEYINNLCDGLEKRKSNYLTCHCTGIKPYEVLKVKMGEKMGYIKTGTVLEI